MGLTRSTILALALGACGGASTTSEQNDAPPMSGCVDEGDCAAPTPYCEPASSTCVQCRFSSHCMASGVCEGQSCRAARSCKELKAELPGLQSGVYRIDVDGTGAAPPTDVFCEMTVDGGGWTLVQRTRWQWSSSMALHSNYAAWHDTTVGTPAVGMAFRLAGMHWPALLETGDLLVSHRVRTTAGGACNPLWYIGRGGSLTLDRTAKTATLAGLTHTSTLTNSTTLSTKDSGPDGPQCVVTNLGVPWFYSSCCSTCPTYQGTYWNDEPHPMANYVGSEPDMFGKLETDVCAGQTPRTADNSAAFRGIDTMEMYLR